MSLFLEISLVICTLTVTFVVLNCLVEKLSYYLYLNLEKSIKKLEEEKDESIKKLINDTDVGAVKEFNTFRLFLIKRENTKVITKIIAWFEIFLFSSLTASLLLFSNVDSFEKTLQGILSVAGGWIAIKIFGSFEQWSGTLLGRSTFYIFLVGTLANIIGSVLIGILFFSFTIKFI